MNQTLYDLITYRRTLLDAQDSIRILLDQVETWIEAEPEDIGMEETRRAALIAFYTDSIRKFPDPADRMMFIQCIAAVDDGEELNLGNIYHDEFITALRECRKAQERELTI